MALRLADQIDALARALKPLDTPQRRYRYLSLNFPRSDLVKDLDKRYRWDLLYATPWDFQKAFFTYVLETGADDRHIDSALRRVVPPLEEK